jgi:hypothetical protein
MTNVDAFKNLAIAIAYREEVYVKFRDENLRLRIQHQISAMYESALYFGIPKSVLETEVKWVLVTNTFEDITTMYESNIESGDLLENHRS